MARFMNQWELELDQRCRRPQRILMLLLAVFASGIAIGIVAFRHSHFEQKANPASMSSIGFPNIQVVPANSLDQPIREKASGRPIVKGSEPTGHPTEKESASWGGYYRPNCERIETKLPDGRWSVSYVRRPPDGPGHRNRIDNPPPP